MPPKSCRNYHIGWGMPILKNAQVHVETCMLLCIFAMFWGIYCISSQNLNHAQDQSCFWATPCLITRYWTVAIIGYHTILVGCTCKSMCFGLFCNKLCFAMMYLGIVGGELKNVKVVYIYIFIYVCIYVYHPPSILVMAIRQPSRKEFSFGVILNYPRIW